MKKAGWAIITGVVITAMALSGGCGRQRDTEGEAGSREETAPAAGKKAAGRR